MSTQAGFGEILAEIGRAQGDSAELSRHILTTSPDVAVSTNLGPWINRRGVFDRHTRDDVFRDGKLASAQRWGSDAGGPAYRTRHRRAKSVSPPRRRRAEPRLHGARILPIGTVYDPFVNRGHDALILCLLPGCALPAGLHTVRHFPGAGRRAAPGDQHAAARHRAGPARRLRAGLLRRAGDPAPPRLRAYAGAGGLSGVAAALDAEFAPAGARAEAKRVIAGAHWVVPPAPGAKIAIAYQGAVAPRGGNRLRDAARGGAGGRPARRHQPDRLYAGWRAAQRARRQGIARRQPYRAPSGAAGAATPRSSACWTVTRRRMPGWAGCAGSG